VKYKVFLKRYYSNLKELYYTKLDILTKADTTMASNFASSSSDLFSQASSSLSTDLKAIPESSFSINTDLSNPFNTNKYFQNSSNSPVAASVVNNPNSNPPFTSGYYTVGKTGKVSFDYLFDGGAYEGELAIFNLEGMGQYQIGSNDFVREAVRRSLSNSTLGYVVISDIDEAARFSGDLKWDKNHNLGEYGRTVPKRENCTLRN
jgi:hypothetical protein